MIIMCDTLTEAETIISFLRQKYAKEILNFVVNKNYGKIYIIIDGNIGAISDEYLDMIHAKKVFSSLERDLYFVKDKSLIPDVLIGKRLYHPNDKMISIIAGPCAIESYEDLFKTAYELKQVGLSVFRAMPNKPRTSPYNFQGVGRIGWEYLERIKKELELPVLAEVFNQEDIDLAAKHNIDIIQIGSRNMQNYDLIKRAAKSSIPTVLKKGMWCNNEQLLKAAEYFYVYGCGNVILSERGIQTHEKGTRNTFDISSIVLLKKTTCLPIMADASHGTGVKELVIPVNCAAVLSGADIIEVEVHVSPNSTIKPGDYFQMIDINEYRTMLDEIERIMPIIGKRFDFIRG